jgi:hypothetical protein
MLLLKALYFELTRLSRQPWWEVSNISASTVAPSLHGRLTTLGRGPTRTRKHNHRNFEINWPPSPTPSMPPKIQATSRLFETLRSCGRRDSSGVGNELTCTHPGHINLDVEPLLMFEMF